MDKVNDTTETTKDDTKLAMAVYDACWALSRAVARAQIAGLDVILTAGYSMEADVSRKFTFEYKDVEKE